MTLVACAIGFGFVGFYIGELCPPLHYCQLDEPFSVARNDTGTVFAVLGAMLGLVVAVVSLALSPPPGDKGSSVKRLHWGIKALGYVAGLLFVGSLTYLSILQYRARAELDASRAKNVHYSIQYYCY